MLLVLAFGCYEPFALDRHDLADLRIVGMSAPEGDFAQARAFVWEGSDAWSESPPAQAWSAPEAGLIALAITDATGATERGELWVEPGHVSPTVEAWSRELTDDGAELSLTLSEAATVHWMAPTGTFDESGAATTTWTGVDAEGKAVAAGVWPVVALWFDGAGGVGWETFDVPVGVSGPFLAQDGRLLPVPASTPEGGATLLATLTQASAVRGFELTGGVADDGTETPAAPCGTADGHWTATDLLERRCGLGETVGARVRLRGEVVP